MICHGIPDLRELQDGDIVNVDVSAILDGFHTDLNEVSSSRPSKAAAPPLEGRGAGP